MRAAVLILALLSTPVQAQMADVDQRLKEIVALLNGGGDYEATFAPHFRAEVPRARFDTLATQIRAQVGRAESIGSIERRNALEATAQVRFERGTARVRLSLMPGGTRQVAGFVISGTTPQGDSLSRVATEIAALPGKAAIGVYALDDAGPAARMEVLGAEAAPIGSAFKLWVLAELTAQVDAGKRHWDDVVPLAAPSLPSGITQDWPRGTPMTLQGLATLMITISDNSATDTLMETLGRDAVDRRAASLGADPASLPVLTTAEMFRLKHPANAARIADWATATPDRRRQLLADPAVARTPLDPAMFGDKPLAPQIEWFASPRAMARTLDWLSRKGDAQALAILSAAPQDRHGFAYAGGKGGSEPGVLSLNHLVRDAGGRWYVVAANQHRTDGPVDQGPLAILVARTLDILAAAH